VCSSVFLLTCGQGFARWVWASIAFSIQTAVDLHRKAEAKEAERQRLLAAAKNAQEQKEKQEREWLEKNKRGSPQTT